MPVYDTTFHLTISLVTANALAFDFLGRVGFIEIMHT